MRSRHEEYLDFFVRSFFIHYSVRLKKRQASDFSTLFFVYASTRHHATKVQLYLNFAVVHKVEFK